MHDDADSSRAILDPAPPQSPPIRRGQRPFLSNRWRSWRGCAHPAAAPGTASRSFDSIRKYTLEEAYEVFDAIERRDFPHLAEELGDLLLQVLFYAEMAANEGHFTIADVLDT